MPLGASVMNAMVSMLMNAGVLSASSGDFSTSGSSMNLAIMINWGYKS